MVILHGIVANVLGSDIVVSKFEHKSHYYVHFGLIPFMNSFILKLNSTTTTRIALELNNQWN